MCCKGVTKASKAVLCDSCDRWTHVRCTPLVSLQRYNQCVLDDAEIDFVCDNCSWSSLPFHGVDVGADGHASVDAAAAPTPASSRLSPLIPKVLLQKGLHFIHSNTRSLIPKLPEIRLLLSQTKVSVFAASETWLNSSVNNGEIRIDGFNVVRRDWDCTGGGVALYIKEDIAFNPRPDLSVGQLEAVWIKLLLPRMKGILVCACYRPPNDNEFISRL